MLDDQWQATGEVTVVRISTSSVSAQGECEPPISDSEAIHLRTANPADLALAEEEARELFNPPAPIARPFLREFAGRLLEPTTLTRIDAVDDPHWYRSDYFEHFRRQVGLDDCIVSAVPLPGCQPYFAAVCLSRPSQDNLAATDPELARFSEQDRRLVEIMHAELRWAYDEKLIAPHESADASGPANSPSDPVARLDVSPRLQRVLYRLLAGDSEKQAATRLSLSRHTVHEYVRALYRELGVCSRAELMARFITSNG
jgi:DNA-binding CsgD family transcriptional regulator